VRLLLQWEVISITNSECAFATVGIRQAMRMLIILSAVACPIVQYFFTLSHNDRIFEKKNLLNINLCFDFLDIFT
jgi:hypothetical protein